MASLTKNDISRLLGQLNQTNLTQINQDLYQVIKEIINTLNAINIAAGVISSPSGSLICKCNNPGLLFTDGNSDDIPSYIPGPKGDTGAAGASGISGVSGFMVAQDGIDGFDSYIPGPTGPAGSAGGGSAWSLIATSSPGAVNFVDFTGLGAYSDIRVLVRLMTYGSADNTIIRVSTDGGATYLAAATDYREVLGTGQESGVGGIQLYGATTTAGRSGEVVIEGFNLTSPKVSRSNPDTTAVQYLMILPSASAFNAVRVLSAGTNNFTGGTIYVWGR